MPSFISASGRVPQSVMPGFRPLLPTTLNFAKNPPFPTALLSPPTGFAAFAVAAGSIMFTATACSTILAATSSSTALEPAAHPPAFPLAILLFHKCSFSIGDACSSLFAARSRCRVGAAVGPPLTASVPPCTLPTRVAPKRCCAAWPLRHFRFTWPQFPQVEHLPRNRA